MKVDFDFAGCKETRLSTSCFILMRGKRCVQVPEFNPEDPRLEQRRERVHGSCTWWQYRLGSKGDSRRLWAAVRSRFGAGFIGSQRCCYEKRSGEDTSSSHTVVMVASAGDDPRVADLGDDRD